jgi:type VI secretion system protein ImpD
MPEPGAGSTPPPNVGETLTLSDVERQPQVDLRSIVAQGVSKEWYREPLLSHDNAAPSHRADSGMAGSLREFLASSDIAETLRLWLGSGRCDELSKQSPRRCLEQIQRDIAQLDRLVNKQLNAVIHHPDFQRLEASWRGLQYLTESKDRYSNPNTKLEIKVLNVRWRELRNDLDNGEEIEQSQLFKKVYDECFGQAGGDPFTAIVADYEIRPNLTKDYPFDDLAIVRGLAQVGAASFCPIMLNAHPAMFGINDFAELRHSVNLESLHNGLEYFAWKKFRESPDSRFVAMAMPRMLMRKPYRGRGHWPFPFEEAVAHKRDYLWGSASFGLGEVLIRAACEGGWFANLRGVKPGLNAGGLVTGCAHDEFTTESPGLALKPLTEIVLSETFERELARAGFLGLCACRDVPAAAFYSSVSVQKPAEYDAEDASQNAKLSSLLNQILCVSRFAHYIKCIARDKIGSGVDRDKLEHFLRNWLAGYMTPDTDASERIRCEKPLREGDVKVISLPGRPGEYNCIIELAPHYELDDILASMQFRTRLVKPAGN